MVSSVNDLELSTHESEILGLVLEDVAQAFQVLTTLPCERTRHSLGSIIAQNWSRQDINLAWNTIARSSLAAKERQRLLNELWN